MTDQLVYAATLGIVLGTVLACVAAVVVSPLIARTFPTVSGTKILYPNFGVREGARFMLPVNSLSGRGPTTYKIPQTWSVNRGTNITGVSVPAGSILVMVVTRVADRWEIYGDPLDDADRAKLEADFLQDIRDEILSEPGQPER
jgi:hypothetical protein